MGRVKEFLTDYDFYPLSNTYVCSRCFEDYGLKEFISENAEYDECSYCGKWSRKKNIAIHINDLIIYLLECIHTEWGDPNDEGVGWESKEGGWVSAKVVDTYDLLFDELELEINHKELQDLLVQTLSDKEWCQKDPHGLLIDRDLYFSWQRFSRQIKHEARYVFFKLTTYKEYSPESDIIKEPYEIMEHLGFIVKNLDLIRTLPKNTKIYRARASSKGERFKKVEELGPPDAAEARYSNRMSPAGIPMFYGSLEQKTALEEISDPNKSKPAIVSLATFTILDDVKILDLTNVPATQSIFDEKMRNHRLFLSFLNAFLANFIKPIVKDGREHIDYVPTQVVTEYFRHVFFDEGGEQVQGILYPSSRRKKGIACVLFFDQSNCTENQHSKTSWQK
jgi:DNA-directed RNA polymerase subunit RPC12/RpoP